MKKCSCHIFEELHLLIRHNEKIASELLRLLDHLNRKIAHMEMQQKKY